MDKKIEKEYILLVESKDEVRFFNVYLKHLGIEDIQPIEAGGRDKFQEYFPLFIAASGLNTVKSYAIIRDADENIYITFQSVVGLLHKYKQSVPKNVFNRYPSYFGGVSSFQRKKALLKITNT